MLQTGHSAWWRDEVLERGRRMWARHLLAAVAGTPLDDVTWPAATSPADRAAGAPPGRQDVAVRPRTARTRRGLIVALGVLWPLVPLLLAGARWPSWWSWIAPEQSPMTWLQSVVLVLAAAVSLLIAYVIAMAGEPSASGTSTTRDRTAWWVLAAGLALLPMIWRALAVDAAARTALAVGVGLAALAVGMDSIDPATWTPRAERVQQTAEEVVEWAGGLALLAAVTLRLLGLLDAVIRPREGASAVDPAVTGVATRDT